MGYIRTVLSSSFFWQHLKCFRLDRKLSCLLHAVQGLMHEFAITEENYGVMVHHSSPRDTSVTEIRMSRSGKGGGFFMF